MLTYCFMECSLWALLNIKIACPAHAKSFKVGSKWCSEHSRPIEHFLVIGNQLLRILTKWQCLYTLLVDSCFSLGGNLYFPDILQFFLLTLTTDWNIASKTIRPKMVIVDNTDVRRSRLPPSFILGMRGSWKTFWLVIGLVLLRLYIFATEQITVTYLYRSLSDMRDRIVPIVKQVWISLGCKQLILHSTKHNSFTTLWVVSVLRVLLQQKSSWDTCCCCLVVFIQSTRDWWDHDRLGRSGVC